MIFVWGEGRGCKINNQKTRVVWATLKYEHRKVDSDWLKIRANQHFLIFFSIWHSGEREGDVHFFVSILTAIIIFVWIPAENNPECTSQRSEKRTFNCFSDSNYLFLNANGSFVQSGQCRERSAGRPVLLRGHFWGRQPGHPGGHDHLCTRVLGNSDLQLRQDRWVILHSGTEWVSVNPGTGGGGVDSLMKESQMCKKSKPTRAL